MCETVTNIKRGLIMPDVQVVKAGKSKFKVMIDYIQRGIEYSSEAQAESEAKKIREDLETRHKK